MVMAGPAWSGRSGPTTSTVVVIGGDGTLRSALKLAEEGLQVVGVPKTIDNDIASTDVTFGFDTAVQIATEAVDRIATTAEAHNRIMLVEVMGRTAGMDRHLCRHRRRGRRPPHPRDPLRPRGARHDHPPPPPARAPVLGGGGVRGGGTAGQRPDADAPLDAFGFKRLGGVAYEIGPTSRSSPGSRPG
jgi:ATP-dependent phosphofructokinase / diphosphate-dependent phosphofructokinase